MEIIYATNLVGYWTTQTSNWYLYFLFDRLLDDVRTINEDLQELKALCKKKLAQDKPIGEVPDDEFLGI